MNDFYLKYETSLKMESDRNIIENDLKRWKNNLIEESDIIGKINNGYKVNLSPDIIIIFTKIKEIITNHIQFINDFNILMIQHDIDFEQNEHIAKVNFLREYYNNILIIIQKVFSFENKLVQMRKGNEIDKKIKITFHNEFTLKILNDISVIKSLQVANKDKLKSKSIYPSSMKMDKMFEKYLEKANKENDNINKRLKYCTKQATKSKLLSQLKEVKMNTRYRYDSSKKADRAMGFDPFYFEMQNISEGINNCIKVYNEIKKKADDYCVCNDKNAIGEFNKIKINTIKLKDNVDFYKGEIRSLAKQANEIMQRMEKFEKSNQQLIKENNEVMKLLLESNDNLYQTEIISTDTKIN